MEGILGSIMIGKFSCYSADGKWREQATLEKVRRSKECEVWELNLSKLDLMKVGTGALKW
jgi:hypothetical protein